MPQLDKKTIRSLCAGLFHGAQDAHIKIKPDLDYVVLSGDEDEAAGQFLRGTVTLTTPISQPITGIRLSLVGYHRFSTHRSPRPIPGTARQTTILKHDWAPFTLDTATQTPYHGSKHIVVYEWPFEVLVSGKTLQSTQGCYRCSIAYYLTASSIRKGSKTYPQAFRAIRVIRTLPLSAFELMDATTVEGHSARNFRYSASIAHQAVALGAQVPVEFELRPTKPGLRLLGVSCELVEIHGIEHEQATDHENFRSSSRVFRWELLDAPTEKGGDGAVCLKRELPLPDLAAKCSPDVDACGIHVSHALHFDMLAEDAQGEKITHRATLPITLFVSPHLPIDGSGHFVKGRGSMSSGDWDGVQIPPRYSEHEADELLELSVVPSYSEIAPSPCPC